ncbi:MAG: amidohydrolase family protein [bacterium]
MHLHAGPAGWTGPGAPNDSVNERHLGDVLATMDRHGVRLALISGPMEFVEFWKSKAPDRFVASVMLPCDRGVAPLGGRQCFSSGAVVPELAWLRSRYSSGALGAMGEITAQYAGLSPADASLEPYFSLAEELDIPVGVHTGLSHPGTPYHCCPKFRAGLGRPLLLEEVLVRHPKLRIYAMHGGSPYAEEMLAAMALYPQVHIDISAISYLMPRPHFHAYLRRLVDHGFGDRILFGSDNFPLGDCIDAIESAAFLSEEQKADILCRNAARFLRLDADQACTSTGA